MGILQKKTVTNDILITLDGAEWTSGSSSGFGTSLSSAGTKMGYGWSSQSYESEGVHQASDNDYTLYSITTKMGGPFGEISKIPCWNIGSNGLRLKLTALYAYASNGLFISRNNSKLYLKFDLTTDGTTTDTISFTEIRLTNTETGKYVSYATSISSLYDELDPVTVTDGTVLDVTTNFYKSPTSTETVATIDGWLKSAYENNQKIKVEFTPAPDGYV